MGSRGLPAPLFSVLAIYLGIISSRIYCQGCPGDIDVTAPPGKTCAVVTWTFPSWYRPDSSRPEYWHGDCWPGGSYTAYFSVGSNRCDWKTTVRVIRCYLLSSFSNGQRSCSGDEDNVYGSVCTHTCNAGYTLRGESSSVTCQQDGTWSSSFPICYEQCSWRNSHCWPGDCEDGISVNCQCRSGFRRTSSGSARRCELAQQPDLNTCRVAVIDTHRNSKNSTNVGNKTECQSQRDEAVNTVPVEVYFAVKADLEVSVGPSLPSYVSRSAVGIVGAQIILEKVDLSGASTQVKQVSLSGAPYCQVAVSSTSPVITGSLHDCDGTIHIPNLSLRNGESLCADMETSAGGYYNLRDEGYSSRGTETFQPVTKSKRVCFLYDSAKPLHCFQSGSAACDSQTVLRLSTRLTREPEINVHIQGWLDPIPSGGSASSASGIEKYRLEVHGVDVEKTSVSVQDDAKKNYTMEWDGTAGPFNVLLKLPDEGRAQLCAVILEVHDVAGNVAYTRRLVLYDNTSSVELFPNASLQVFSANPRADMRWQTNISNPVCVDWKNRFHNSEMYHNNFLMPVNPDTGRQILGQYDQQSGLLPVAGTKNVKGIVKFEMAWSRDNANRTSLKEIPDVHAQTTCLQEQLTDGETYNVWIRATDIMGNFKEENVTVSIDHTEPSLSIKGLRGRFGRDGLYAHNDTDLSKMVLLVHADDPHSGLKTLLWTLGTTRLATDVGRGAVGINRLDNVTDCQGESECYCPSVGVCEIHQYLFTFTNLVHNNSHVGQHHRDYYITITATNHASLEITETIEILVDDSPPTVGVVLEGLSDDDQAEMDFTSIDVVHVRWHGFLDHESGILLYRVVLAERCLTDEEMDAVENATEVEQGETTSFKLPSAGRYYTTVVAYNGALEPSRAACSDGITYDTTPPRLVNVSITHARTGHEVACTQPDQPWLVNTNMTRVRLARTSDCLRLCFENSSAEDVGYLSISSNHTEDDEASDHFCRTLPIMTEDSHIVLPSDYLKLTWAAVDAESEMEEYYVGMGTDRTTASAPDLLPFTPTHGHHSYHERHSGLGHGAVFFIFLRALSKAGLDVNVTLGPVIIDETPPDVTQVLNTTVDGDFLTATWRENTFVDSEQPDGVDLGITFRVGFDNNFVTEFLAVPTSSLASCHGNDMKGCARFPLSTLYAHDTESGRLFFFQLLVTNAAGHLTSVNTSAVRLPDHLPPSHAVITEVIKPESADDANNDTSGVISKIPEDVDVIVQREEICVAWHGLYREDEVDIEVGIGTAPAQDDLVAFRAVENRSPACIDASSLPGYRILYSVVKATSPGGSTVFSSDGFHVIPANDPSNGLQVFSGVGCDSANIVWSKTLTSSTNPELTIDPPIHTGDILFVKFTPFIQNVAFPGSVLLQTTLTGYQIVPKSSHLTVALPASVVTNTSVEVLTCLKDATILPMPENHVTVTWEVSGPWTKLINHLNIEMVDGTCLRTSQNDTEFKEQFCLLGETRAPAARREARLPAQDVIQDHEYIAIVASCFDDACLPSISSTQVTFGISQRSVVFTESTMLAQTEEDMTVRVNAQITPFPSFDAVDTSHPRPCVFRWAVTRDQHGALPVTDWHVGESTNCSRMEVEQLVNYTGSGHGSLYVCLQPVFPWRADNPTCHRLVRSSSINRVDPLHVIELPHTTFRQTDFDEYLHSYQLGSKLHELYDLDLDFARSDVMLSAVLTYSKGKSVAWFLMTDPHVPADSTCVEDAACVTSQANKTSTVMFPRADSKLQDGHVYFVCARLSPASTDLQANATTSDICGDGVVIDDTPSDSGSVVISNANSGYVANSVAVMWSGFSDIEASVQYLPDEVTLNFSVALGSYPGWEDLAHFVSVGQRTTWTFQHLSIASGATCIATVKAEDRVGHVTNVWSQPVIFDNTPPTVDQVTVGTITRENFVAGAELPVRWEGVEDIESGIALMEIAVSTKGGHDDVIPFQYCNGNSVEITDTAVLVDGHSYVVLLKVVNGAGLTTVMSSEPFIVDSSPPGPGQVWNSAPETDNHGTYSTDVGVYRVYWAGFSEPHSGLDYYRVGLGSQPGHTDIHPFVYVGHQTTFTWARDFEQGKKYYVTVEACNRAGLCRVTSSNSMTFDDSPPTPGHVTVGFDGRHSKYLEHNSSVPVQWTGFSDPQSGIQEFWWCVGTRPENCDVMPVTQTLLSRATVRAGLTLPVDTPLYVTVRARNPAGLDTVSVSDSFTVDPTPPEVVVTPHFLSPRDGSVASSQWDRSVLCLAWRFDDPDSSVVSHTINIRSRLTGRLVTDPIVTGADTELTLTLDADHLLLDGDSHWAAVTACNAAGLCRTAISGLLLVDSTPPVVGTFTSPLTWKKIQGTNGTRVALNVTWHRFADAESGVVAYYIIVGRKYNGDELTSGQVKVAHDDTNHIQQRTLSLTEDVRSDDILYLTMWAENAVGLHSPMARMSFNVLHDNSNGTSGTLVLIRHSCAVDFCTQECTCAPTGEFCKQQAERPCQKIEIEDATLSSFRVSAYIGQPAFPGTFTTSAKCLEGHWQLSDQNAMSNISRFEWSFSLANTSEGEGIFNKTTEAVWRDIGRNTSAVHCIPGKSVLKSGRSYILHVRAWLSTTVHVTFLSPPITVDHTPPQVRRGQAVLDSKGMCSEDVDYVTTEPAITACWDGVFRDAESQITRYEVWLGTSAHADDHIDKKHVGLNTSWTFSTAGLEQGTRYYVTVRAANGAGLMMTAVSDGVTVDVTPPVTGVVFAAHRYTHRPAQTSTTTLPASWHGFQDAHSGLTSHYVAIYDVTDNVTSLTPLEDAGIQTEYTLDGLTLEHNHRYKVMVKAKDAAGLESEPVESRPILIDVTPPEGVTCINYQLQEERNLTYSRTSSFVHDSYTTEFSAPFLESEEMMKIEIVTADMEPDAIGYMTIEEMKMPIYFKYAQSGVATAEQVFMAAGDGNQTLNVEVLAKPGSQIQARLYRCNDTIVSEEDSVSVHQMSQYAVSVRALVRDKESGIRSMLVGVGTTPGSLQVRPLTPVGHSGHTLVNMQLQHGLPVYATVHAENYAGQWSRFISWPITMDRTPPEVSEVAVFLRYEGEGQEEVWVDSRWSAEDAESGVVSCTCQLEGESSLQPSVQKTSHLTPGVCQWQLLHPQHEASVWVTVSCVNGVQMHAALSSEPAVVLLRPPDLSQGTVVSLSNNALLSPFDGSDLGVRSSNSSLEFFWHGIHDPTITEVQYRFLHESRPLSAWSLVDIYKTSAILEAGESRLPTGNVTAQVQAINARNLTSEILSKSVRLDDGKPLLTGQPATVTLTNGELQLNWNGVFTPSTDITFAVYAGTAQGYGDVINHVITKATSYRGQWAKDLSSIFVTIQAVDVNGQSGIYSVEIKL